jgi:energy-coupling factor transport system permease protein
MTFYREGMLYALKIGLRIYNIITSVSLLVLTTRPSDLIEALVRKGLSPKIGYVLSSILQIIPQMTSMMNTITDAQRARGMETEGSLLVRMKAFIPLLGPMVMSSLVGTRERAMALEVRAFSSSRKKTFLNKPMESAQSTIWRVVLLIILIGAVIWRVTS